MVALHNLDKRDSEFAAEERNSSEKISLLVLCFLVGKNVGLPMEDLRRERGSPREASPVRRHRDAKPWVHSLQSKRSSGVYVCDIWLSSVEFHVLCLLLLGFSITCTVLVEFHIAYVFSTLCLVWGLLNSGISHHLRNGKGRDRCCVLA